MLKYADTSLTTNHYIGHSLGYITVYRSQELVNGVLENFQHGDVLYLWGNLWNDGFTSKHRIAGDRVPAGENKEIRYSWKTVS